MVSNEEIKKMLENRRRGIKTESKTESPRAVPPTTGRKAVSPPTQTCESCGAQNPPDAKFCIKCGQTLKAPEKVEEKKVETASADALPRSGMDGIDYKTCPNCSHQNKPQAKFCVVCGHKLEDAPGEPGTGSLLDRVPTTAPEDDKPAQEQPTEEQSPAVAELFDEESVPEETEKISLLSRKVPEETIREEPAEEIAEEAVVKESYSEEVPAESAPEKVPAEETVPEEAPLSEVQEEAPEEELPQVKTIQLGQSPAETGEKPVATEVEEAAEADQSSESVSSEVDPVEKIKKAKELLDIGAISEEEFEEIKKKYLALI